MTVETSTPGGFASVFSASLIIRAGVVALIIGTALTLLNQWGAVTGAEAFEILPLILVYQTPFLVVLVSQALAIKQARIEFFQAPKLATGRESFVQTVTAHGIPLRAGLLGALMGISNTGVVAAANIASTGSLLPLPAVLIAQAFTLPVLFGFISQSFTYRRAIVQLASAHAQGINREAS